MEAGPSCAYSGPSLQENPGNELVIKAPVYKVGIIGSTGCGKTSFALQLSYGYHPHVHRPTGTLHTMYYTHFTANGPVKFEIMDTPGAVPIWPHMHAHLKKMDCLIVAYDLADSRSHLTALELVHNCYRDGESGLKMPIAICGMKKDLIKWPIPPSRPGHHIKMFYTSAESDENLEEAFEWFSQVLWEKSPLL